MKKTKFVTHFWYIVHGTKEYFALKYQTHNLTFYTKHIMFIKNKIHNLKHGHYELTEKINKT